MRALALAGILLLTSGCDVFLGGNPNRGQAGEPCFSNNECGEPLVCEPSTTTCLPNCAIAINRFYDEGCAFFISGNEQTRTQAIQRCIDESQWSIQCTCLVEYVDFYVCVSEVSIYDAASDCPTACADPSDAWVSCMQANCPG